MKINYVVINVQREYTANNQIELFNERLTEQKSNEWVSDYCLMPIQQFSAISWPEQVNFHWDDDDEVRFVLDQHAEFDLYSASSLKQQFADWHVAPLGHIILIPSRPVFALSP